MSCQSGYRTTTLEDFDMFTKNHAWGMFSPAPSPASRSTFSAKRLLPGFLALLSVLACSDHSNVTNPAAATLATRALQVPPPASKILYGLHSDISWYTDSAYRTRTVTVAKTLHAQVLRVELTWEWIEYKRNRRDWTVIDDVVKKLLAAGIRPLFVVSGSPSWAVGVTEAQDENFYLHVPTDSAKFHTWVAKYASFVNAAAQRYKGKVTMWEIGNEPNDAYSWRPAPSIGQYAAWYVALRSAIKQVDPTSLVALGGLNGLGYDMDAPGMRGTVFLAGLYALHVYPDVVAIHTYSNRGQGPDVHIAEAGNFDDIALTHNLMVANGQGNKPMWITEWGWAVDNVSPTQQADYLSKSLGLLESTYAPYVTVAIYYSEFDPSPTYHYGLYTQDLVMRPAATVFQNFMSTR